MLPEMYASGAVLMRESNNETTAVTTAGMNTGTAMPTPGTGLASQCSTTATMAMAMAPGTHKPRLTNR